MQQDQFIELKWKAEAEQQSKQKVQKVIKYIEDLLKVACRFESKQEWSADHLGDFLDEATVIEAKAYFNKHSPTTISCLKHLQQHYSAQTPTLS